MHVPGLIFLFAAIIMSLCHYHPLGKHVSITPSASTSVTSERESGVGGVALDEGGGATRGKHQSNDNKMMAGSDRGRGVSPISLTDPQQSKGATTNNSRSGGRKWGATKSSKESSSVASTARGSSSSISTSSNSPHHQGGSANPPHTGVTSTSHRNNTPPPTSTSQSNSSRSSQQPSASSISGKRNDTVSKELPPSGRAAQQQALAASRGKGNQSRSVSVLISCTLYSVNLTSLKFYINCIEQAFIY